MHQWEQYSYVEVKGQWTLRKRSKESNHVEDNPSLAMKTSYFPSPGTAYATYFIYIYGSHSLEMISNEGFVFFLHALISNAKANPSTERWQKYKYYCPSGRSALCRVFFHQIIQLGQECIAHLVMHVLRGNILIVNTPNLHNEACSMVYILL